MAEPIGANQTREERLARIEERIRTEREAYQDEYFKQQNPNLALSVEEQILIVEANADHKAKADAHYAEVDRLVALWRDVAHGKVFTAPERPRPSHL